jgi:hypothetical protein
MSNGEGDPEVGQQLRAFFERLDAEGIPPVMGAFIDQQEEEGALSAEAARTLRESDKEAMQSHLQASAGGKAVPFIIVWPF